VSHLSVFSLRNRALIALLTIVVALFGGYALTVLKLELFPSLTLPNVTIITTYPGASPEAPTAPT
jgi:hydrophobic/amphiphilic exporter-1 (mainly G- bacteria), HAE1 family